VSFALAQVILSNRSGITKDQVVSDFVFASTTQPDVASMGPEIKAALHDFYEAVNAPQVVRLSSYLGPQIDRSVTAKIKVYDITTHLTGGAHGSPVYLDSWTLGAVGDASVQPDNQAAAVLSFHSDYGSAVEFLGPHHPAGAGTRPKARHRGRIYFGPLAANAMAQDGTTANPILSGNLKRDLAGAAAHLASITGVLWSVWSRKAPTVGQVVGGWVDGSYDTVRRRKIPSTARTTFGTG
jgi:hypothetical protein